MIHECIHFLIYSAVSNEELLNIFKKSTVRNIFEIS